MEQWKKRSLELVVGLALTNKQNPAVVPYRPQKTEITKEERPYFKRSSPEGHGIPSGRIVEMLDALERDTRVHLHNMIVLVGGEVVCECSAPGYGLHIAHLSHSMSKTVTGMAVGFLMDEGRLSPSDKVLSFFPEIKEPNKKLEGLTVAHLLAMQSGVPFSEAGSVTESEWTRAFLESAPGFAVGTKFAYNSMNSYLLAVIVCRICGTSLCEFLAPRLFAPLGITNYFWELGPEGIEKGGWGLFLSAESWAKLGMLILNGGTFEDKRILSEKFVREATLTHSTSPESSGDFNYGYQIWVSRVGREILFNGMLGQNVWIYPEEDIVVAINAGNNELFQQSPALDIIRRYLRLPRETGLVQSSADRQLLLAKQKHFFEGRHWIRPKRKKSGLGVLLHLKPQDPYIPMWDALLGTYMFRENNQGILPIFVRAMQNNYSGGIESFRFHREGKHLFFTSREGGVDYTLELGLYEYKETVLDFAGEPYIVRALAVAIRDEDYKNVYKIELIFPEMPNRRAIKLSFPEEGELLVRMDEMPNQRIATSFMESMPVTNPKTELLSKLLGRRLGENFLEEKITELFAPILVGARYGSSEFDAILEEQEEALQAELARTAFISRALEKLSSPKQGASEGAAGEGDGPLKQFWGKVKGKVLDILPKKATGISDRDVLTHIDVSEAFELSEEHPMFSLPPHLRPSLSDGDEIDEELFERIERGEITLDEVLSQIDGEEPAQASDGELPGTNG